jgi:hypothetical protein
MVFRELAVTVRIVSTGVAIQRKTLAGRHFGHFNTARD